MTAFLTMNNKLKNSDSYIYIKTVYPVKQNIHDIVASNWNFSHVSLVY